MVKYEVFGVERDIDIPGDVFPTESEIEEMEGKLPGCEHGWTNSVHGGLKLHYRKFLPRAAASTKSCVKEERREGNTTTTTYVKVEERDSVEEVKHKEMIKNIAKPKPEAPKAIIIWMHGIQTHSGRAHILDGGKRKINMALLSDTCLRRDWALYALDMIGHGYSEGNRFYVPSFESIRDDCIAFVKSVASLHNDHNCESITTIFLCGESFGANIILQVARYFQDHPMETPKGFNSVILLAPGVFAPSSVITSLIIMGLEYFVTPWIPYWKFPTCVPNPGLPDYLWREPEILYLNAQEKRVSEMLFEPGYRHANFGTSLTLVKGVVHARKNVIPGFRVPLAVVHGTEDRAVPMEGSTDYLLQNIATHPKDISFKRIKGGYHDLLADPATDEVIHFITEWIQKRLHCGNETWIYNDGDDDDLSEKTYNTAATTSNAFVSISSQMTSAKKKLSHLPMNELILMYVYFGVLLVIWIIWCIKPMSDV